MKPKELTLEERAVVHSIEDIPLFEIIKGMTLEELRSFDCYSPLDMKHYRRLQKGWLEEEKYLVGKRLGHNRAVSSKDLLDDFEKHHNGERFRVYYVLKFPQLIDRC